MNGVFDLSITGASGDDEVTIDFGGEFNDDATIRAELHGGDDSLDFSIAGHISADLVDLILSTAEGNDEVALFFGGNIDCELNVDVDQATAMTT